DLVALFNEGVVLAGEHGTWWMLAMAAGVAGASLATTDVDGGRVLVGQAEEAAAASGNPFVLGAVAMAHGRLYGQLGDTDADAERFTTPMTRFHIDGHAQHS